MSRIHKRLLHCIMCHFSSYTRTPFKSNLLFCSGFIFSRLQRSQTGHWMKESTLWRSGKVRQLSYFSSSALNLFTCCWLSLKHINKDASMFLFLKMHQENISCLPLSFKLGLKIRNNNNNNKQLTVFLGKLSKKHDIGMENYCYRWILNVYYPLSPFLVVQ